MISHKTEHTHRVRFALQRIGTLCLALAIGVGLTVTAGCKEEPPPPPPKRDPPPPPPPPQPKPGELRSEVLPVDTRVVADTTVVDDATRDMVIAALEFADAFARGDTTALEQMFDTGSIRVLREMESDQVWLDETGQIDTVSLVNVSGTEDGSKMNVMFIVGLSDGDSESLTWEATERGDMWIFEPKVEIPPLRPLDGEGDGEQTAADDAEGDSGGSGSPRTAPPTRSPRDPRRVPQDPRSPGPG